MHIGRNLLLILVDRIDKPPEILRPLLTGTLRVLRRQRRILSQYREVEVDRPNKAIRHVRVTYLGNRPAVPSPTVRSKKVREVEHRNRSIRITQRVVTPIRDIHTSLLIIGSSATVGSTVAVGSAVAVGTSVATTTTCEAGATANSAVNPSLTASSSEPPQAPKTKTPKTDKAVRAAYRNDMRWILLSRSSNIRDESVTIDIPLHLRSDTFAKTIRLPPLVGEMSEG